ncbi:IS481 family transposase [Roseomonas sp. OT10]|uniref:IS481 family transposase n=1 Tax=Roseomonas cutis TaxID=2897332 RepID=UPI001E35ED98|nr:IS481 family transposase [Roseomonas sp. OT10]UFN48376.1 IS481 family transposase [Roseomonas sp. OT10]
MPWKALSVIESRREFVRLAGTGEVSVAELSRRFGISRQTGFALLRRYREAGEAGLEDASRRPRTSPRRVGPEMEARLLELRAAHPRWGGRKLARRLRDLGVEAVPAPSTVTQVLRRAGLLEAGEMPDRRASGRFERSAPNELWQIDFKGHIPAGKRRCHPLTVLDDHSRYALGILACAGETLTEVQARLSEVFRRYGLPAAILCDNGSPWGACGQLGRLPVQRSAFEVWLMRLGVATRHGRPRHPQTQGKDERFHRSLDVEVLQGRHFADLEACQRAFQAWRPVYNEQRPHEALGLAVPASRYQPSRIPFPRTLPLPDYYATDLVRRVRPDGCFKLKGHLVGLSQAFAGLDIALRPTSSQHLLSLHFMRFHLANLDISASPTIIHSVRDVSVHPSSISPV